MSERLGTYSFLPWLRRGVANKISGGTATRATIHVPLKLEGEAVSGGGTLIEDIVKDVQLYGPGDLTGIDPRAIVRTEPRTWITNFEPNYIPAIEFYDEDFPWRYTPVAPDSVTKRLLPWITLVVLEEGVEFNEGKNIKDRPLPYIEVSDANLFPPADQLWAWAHVHVNKSLGDQIVSNDMNAVLPLLQGVLDNNPDHAYSRIVCPRRLKENAAYHAFLIPTFETGRLAGLNLDPAQAPGAIHSAWAPYQNKPEAGNYPVYFRWFFRTGTVGDFEYLVRLLQPKPVDSRVGRRDMDVQEPGSNLPGIADPLLGGVLRLGGALQVPEANLNEEELEEAKQFEEWDDPSPHPFQRSLAAFINLADDYSGKTSNQANQESGVSDAVKNDPDPLITPPLYGRWHAMVRRLLNDNDGTPISTSRNWVCELNLDPRFRVPAGFGTRVVQEKQEEYMNSAWEQIGEVLEANRRIRAAQLAKAASFIWYDRHLKPLLAANVEKSFSLTAPVQRRVLSQNLTVFHHVKTSPVTPAVASAPMRRIIRPRARLVRSLPFTGSIQPDTLIARINDGAVSAALPKQTPPGVVTVNEVSETLQPKDAPQEWIDLLRKYPWLQYAPLGLALLVLLLLLLAGASVAAWILFFVLIAALGYIYRLFRGVVEEIERADAIREEGQTPESVDGLPRSPDFRITEPGSGFTPRPGATDSGEAARFKTGLKEVYSLIQASKTVSIPPPRKSIEVEALADTMILAINPDVTISRRTFHGVRIPGRLKDVLVEQFVEAMAYPEIDQPMYEPLKTISSELFLPNINLIEQNSVTLVETNQRFIEAYMVGLNHEFARELLWREYPTDQRGSYFRQFWDVRGYLETEGLDKEALKEKLRDIPPLDKWSKYSELGQHDHRQPDPTKKKNEVVLVIRGELLKKYPNTVVYAHRARWQRDPEPNGPINNRVERRLEELADAEIEKPPRTKIKTPLYEAKVDPDIFFFGFDLTAEEARGGTGENPNDDPGWFFVLKERPGEPRFGFDIERKGDLNVWNDLAWSDVLPSGEYVQINNSTPSLTLVEPTDPEVANEKGEQYQDDRFVAWNKDASSADLAYILYQAPVLVAIHAAEMLGKK
jgi:hypothetical protein